MLFDLSLELANPLTPSTDHLLHCFILFPKIFITYRLKPEKKRMSSFFFKNLHFSLNRSILKDIIGQFLMAEFQFKELTPGSQRGAEVGNQVLTLFPWFAGFGSISRSGNGNCKLNREGRVFGFGNDPL
ncbi:MAG: hypothetical protein A2156_09170 [Deltaproteobacteria bacterium RBG_16_48_10]|nr:MAG: hypothetical protein A2156_09170 [Deltaproteobacteria bacterium RBG_16_48_10]